MMLGRWFGRARWPSVDVYGSRSRGDIKVLSVPDLQRLTEVASANAEWSATGRPERLQRNRSQIKSVILTVYAHEGRSVYRCLVMTVLTDRSKCNFTLDVSAGDFDRLPDASYGEVVSMAHQYLLSFPPLDLDPGQKEAWHRLKKGLEID